MTRQKTVGLIRAALAAYALAALGLMSSASASLTGEYSKFQHCPHDDSEVDLSVETAPHLENPFLGLNCYVGSLAKTVRAPIPTEQTTRTNALSRLTLSLA